MAIKNMCLLLFLLSTLTQYAIGGENPYLEGDDTIIRDLVTNEILWLPSTVLTLGEDYKFKFKNGALKNAKEIPESYLDTFEVYLEEVRTARNLSSYSQSSKECYHDVRIFLNIPLTAPRSTLQEVAENCKSAILGKIVSISKGFNQTTPYSLLTIEIVQNFKEPETKQGASTIKLLYPHAFFEIGDLRFCQSTTDVPPIVGQKVLWFTYMSINHDSKIHYIDPTLIFLEEESGMVIAPMKQMKSFTNLDFDEFNFQTEQFISNLEVRGATKEEIKK